MKNLKNIVKSFFIYEDQNDTYDFTLLESDEEKFPDNLMSPTLSNETAIYNDLKKNIDYLKVKFNLLINSDIVLRNFNLIAKDKTYKAVLLFIDGMVNNEVINNFILRPLMQKKNNYKSSNKSKILNLAKSNKINIDAVNKTNLSDYIYDSLLPQNSVKKIINFDDVIKGVNSGACAVIVDTLNIAFVADIKGYETRQVSTPHNEIVVKGSQEAFVEKLRTNTSLLRRIINNEDLIIENTEVGKISKTKVAICYLKNVANNELVSEVKYRINNLDIDYIISSGQLEQLIQDSGSMYFPQIISTERPDKTAHHLIEGRVIVLLNGSPYSLIMPAVLIDFLSSPEDINLRHQYANFLKIVRFIGAFISLLLPGIYIAIATYHSELLPTELLFTIAAARNSVPFPAIFEITIMEISFELIREGGIRVPSPIGPTIGIVGALILGEAAVNANLISPIMIIIVALTGICSFSIPDFTFGYSLRIFRFLYIFLGFLAGFLGIACGLFLQIAIISNLKSFGVSYTSPYLPVTNLSTNVKYLLSPIWKREKRADFLNSKNSKVQEHISMKWKFGNKFR